jgi:peroxiredoxin
MPGRPAPNAELTDLNGKKVHLKEVLGKQTTILLFSSTTCHFSTEEHGEIQKVKNKFGKRVNLVTILVNETSDSAHRYLRTNQVPGIVLLDTENKGVRAYGIEIVPTVLLVNSKGSVDYFGHFTPADDMINTVLKSWRGERTYASRRTGGG